MNIVLSSARAVGRGGVAASNIKRYDIAPVYHKSVAGGHPRESLEATFDVIQDETNVSGHQLEAEAILVLCQAMSNLPHQEGRLLWDENVDRCNMQSRSAYSLALTMPCCSERLSSFWNARPYVVP